MDHTEATAMHAPDRYLLGELSAAEADAFEEHYFDCAECTDDLRAGMMLMDGGRKLAREASAPAAPATVVPIAQGRKRRPAWVASAMSAAAAAAIVLAVTGPMLVRPAAQQVSVVVLAGAERSEGTPVPAVNGDMPVTLTFDVRSAETFPRYEARIREGGRTIVTVPFTPDPDGAPSSLTIERRKLDAGRHELVVVGIGAAGQETEIETMPFIVRR